MTEHPLAKIKAIHKNTRTTPEMDRLILDSLKKRTTMPMLLRPALGLALGVLAIALGVAWYFSSSSSSTVTPSGQGVDSPRVAGSMKPVGEPKKSLVTPLPMAKQHQVPAMGTPRISPSGPVLLAGTDPVTLPGKQGKAHLIKGVLAEIVSNSAILKRVGNDKILLLEGSARFIVSPLPKG
ncbi:hypothetical protein KJ865_12985, partial [Myxococcota bacterium]|nr:hypothetical protein [Myxococcota bacterium]